MSISAAPAPQNYDVNWPIDGNDVQIGAGKFVHFAPDHLPSTNYALLKAIEIAKEVKRLEEMDRKTEQLIVFLTDGKPTTGVTSSSAIKENIRDANADTQIPIHGLAFGDGADFDLAKDISEESNGFAESIYESGNSLEQMDDDDIYDDLFK